MPQSKAKAAATGLIAIALVLAAAARLAASYIEPPPLADLIPTGASMRLNLSDGSWIVGDPATDGLDVRTAYGNVHLKWSSIRSIQWKGAEGTAQLDMQNGDRVTGRVATDTVDIKTAFGPVTVPFVHVQQLAVKRGAGLAAAVSPASADSGKTPSKAAAVDAGEKPAKAPGCRLLVDLASGSRVIGESTLDPFDVKTEHGDLKLKWELIRSIEWKAGEAAAQLTLANGDSVAGRMTLEKLGLKTLLGPVAIPLGEVQRLSVFAPGTSVFALTFDGKQNYVEVPNDPALDPTGAMTLECWVKTNMAGSCSILGKRRWSENANHGYQLHVTGGVLHAYWEGHFLPGRGGLNDGQWHHAAVTWDGTTRRLYQDGVKVAEDTPGPWTPYDGTFRIGAIEGNHPPDFYEGMICRVRLSKIDRYGGRNFTPETRFAADAGTVALWDFSEGAGDVLRDRSGHGHDGKLVGSPLPPWNEDAPQHPFILKIEEELHPAFDEF